MKILFATMQFGGKYVQGTERYVGSLVDGLWSRGHEVAILAGDPEGFEGPHALGDVLEQREEIGRAAANEPLIPHAAGEVRPAAVTGETPVPQHRLKTGATRKAVRYYHPTCGWTAVRGILPVRLEAWIEAHRPDLIHIANPAHIGCSLMLAARQLSIPYVVTTMDFWWVCPKATLLRADKSICDGTPGWRECVRCTAGDHPRGPARMFGRLPRCLAPVTLAAYVASAMRPGRSAADMLRWPRRRELTLGCLNAAGHVIFPSRATESVIRPHVRGPGWSVIPYGLGPEWFANRKPQRAGVCEPEALTIGYAGAMLPHKGPHLLLEAVRRLGWRRTRVRLAGALHERDYEAALRKGAEGLSVEFCGRIASQDMPAFLRTLDVLVMPSIWPENLPYIMLEAQAAGVAVVGSDIAGVAEQIGEPRLLFQPGSADGLARAMECVRCEPGLVRPARVQTLDEMIDRTEKVYGEVLASGYDGQARSRF